MAVVHRALVNDAEYVPCARCPMSPKPHVHERIAWAGSKWFTFGPAEHAPLPGRCRDEAHHAPDCECALLFDERG